MPIELQNQTASWMKRRRSSCMAEVAKVDPDVVENDREVGLRPTDRHEEPSAALLPLDEGSGLYHEAIIQLVLVGGPTGKRRWGLSSQAQSYRNADVLGLFWSSPARCVMG